MSLDSDSISKVVDNISEKSNEEIVEYDIEIAKGHEIPDYVAGINSRVNDTNKGLDKVA